MHEQGALHSVIETDCLGGIRLTEDRAGRTWFGFHGIFGFGYYEQGTVRRFLSGDEGIYPRQIGAMLADRGGRLWIGSSSPRHWEGLRCYDIAALVADTTVRGSTEVEFTAFTSADGLTDGAILALYEDRDGLLWVGTSEGISRYDGTRFITFTQADGLPHEIVTSITQTEDGILWFGTEGGGVCCYDGEVFQTIQMPDDVGWNVVYVVHQDRQGRIWFGTLGGLVRYTRHREPPEVEVTEVVADWTYAVGEQTEASITVEIPTTAGRISFRFGGEELYSSGIAFGVPVLSEGV